MSPKFTSLTSPPSSSVLKTPTRPVYPHCVGRYPEAPSCAFSSNSPHTLRYLKLLKRSFVTYPPSIPHLQYQISGFGHPKIQLCFERWSSEHCCRGGGEKWKGTTRGVAWVIRIHRHEDRHGRFQWRVWHKGFGFAGGVPFSPPIGLTPFLP